MNLTRYHKCRCCLHSISNVRDLNSNTYEYQRPINNVPDLRGKIIIADLDPNSAITATYDNLQQKASSNRDQHAFVRLAERYRISPSSPAE